MAVGSLMGPTLQSHTQALTETHIEIDTKDTNRYTYTDIETDKETYRDTNSNTHGVKDTNIHKDTD